MDFSLVHLCSLTTEPGVGGSFGFLGVLSVFVVCFFLFLKSVLFIPEALHKYLYTEFVSA